jgi:hypothetical protein
MTDVSRIRLAGLACLAAALLRVASAFADGHVGETKLVLLYAFTDLAITLGLTGWYLRWRASLGWPGLGAWAFTIAAILAVRTTTADPAKYFFAAAALSLGLAALSLAALIGRRAPKAPSLLWLASTVAGGVGGLAFPGENWPFLAASLIFCAGIALAGVALLRNPQGD